MSVSVVSIGSHFPETLPASSGEMAFLKAHQGGEGDEGSFSQYGGGGGVEGRARCHSHLGSNEA